jgi:hypothetical protein
MLGPQAVVGGYVENTMDSLHSAREGSLIAQIAGDVFQRQIGDGAVGTGGTDEDPDVITASYELTGYVAA